MRKITIIVFALFLLPAIVSAESGQGGDHPDQRPEEKPPTAVLDLSKWGRGIYYLDGTVLWEETNGFESLQRMPFIAHAKPFPADTRLLA